MSPGAQVVTRGLFLMVVSSQDMVRVAGDGDKQLVIYGPLVTSGPLVMDDP